MRAGFSVAASPAQISTAPPSSSALGRSPSSSAALAMPKTGTSSANGVTAAAVWRLSSEIHAAKPKRPLTSATNSSAAIPDTLDAVLPAGHPLAERDEIALAELAGEDFVGPPDGTSCHDVTVTGCAAAGFAPAFRHRTLDFHTAMALAAAGLGVTLVPRLGQAAVPPGAIVRPLAQPAPARHVFAATRAGAERRPAVAAVLDAICP